MTTTPVEAEAFRLFREDLFQHIEEAEYLAEAQSWSESQRESARALIGDLVTAIRGLLAQHDPPKVAGQRLCPTCNTYWPCPGIHTIYAVLKDPRREFVKLVQARRP
jgi:hypothetical protein